MPVKPGQHYAMGGIETNENGETCISGLYAAGECACVSVHGSNRLGGNALPELIVFGSRAGRHAAGEDLGEPEIKTGKTDDSEMGDVETPVEPGAVDSDDDSAVADGGASLADPSETVESTLETERERLETMLEKDDGVQQAELRAKLQKTMTDHVNVFRNEEGLKQALRDIREVRESYGDVYVNDPSRTFNTDLIHTIEMRNLLDLGEAITLGALARDEFRGAHWRQENQNRRDDVWLKHTLLSWNDGTPELWYKPTILEGQNKKYEPKERSY